MALGEIAKMTYGYTAKAADAGDLRFVRITDINSDGTLQKDDAKYIDLTEGALERLLRYGDIAVARTGGTFGKTLLYQENEPAVYASFLIKIEFNKGSVLNEYYWHYSKSLAYWRQAFSLVSTGGQPQFNANALKRVRVPIPNHNDQAAIVAALSGAEDCFNRLAKQLTSEIALRESQLAEFRNQLLTFPEKAA